MPITVPEGKTTAARRFGAVLVAALLAVLELRLLWDGSKTLLVVGLLLAPLLVWVMSLMMGMRGALIIGIMTLAFVAAIRAAIDGIPGAWTLFVLIPVIGFSILLATRTMTRMRHGTGAAERSEEKEEP